MPTLTIAVSVSDAEYTAALQHFQVQDALALQTVLARVVRRQISGVVAAAVNETADHVKAAFVQADQVTRDRFLALVPESNGR